ncbi:hypothetical protein B0T22DRAFT_447494 [Podospora appendiculata]|uniref:AGA1 A-agglutinin anchor subunit n=1 Tax=Podospora appendiculata TaxID=314037 RepID=A0AAE0XFZ4_9PEZI|nr:hypothetical protein B0T22DRAFT_447494 [Podospora appendiculata]
MSTPSGALTRSRSIRKPATSSSTKPDKATTRGSPGSNTTTITTNNINNNTTGGNASRTMSPSRLPVKGIGSARVNATTTSAAASNATTSSKQPPPPLKPTRPLSGISMFGRSNSVRQATNASSRESGGGIGADGISRPPRTTRPTPGTTTTTATAARPKSSSGLTSRPASSSGVAASSDTAANTSRTSSRFPSGHMRTRSSVTSLAGATVLRPPAPLSSISSPSSTSTSTTTATATPDRTRPPMSSYNNTRSATHRRQVSNSSSSATPPIAPLTRVSSKPPAPPSPSHNPQPPRPQSSLSSSTATTTTAPASAPEAPPTPQARLPPRPAFSTLQQHYSPAKSLAPKPTTASILAPPSPSKLPANVAISAETSRLQTELLQLHLLHAHSATVAAQWRASAKHALGQRFAEVVRAGDDASRGETEAVERANAAALLAWGGDGARGGGLVEEKVQVLDTVLCGLWSLGEPGGRYARVMRRFEKWVERVVEVGEARRRWAAGEEVGMGMVLLAGEEKEKKQSLGLDGPWRDECRALRRRLDEWRRGVDGLERDCRQHVLMGREVDGDDGEAPSSLVRILTACASLVRDMLAELDEMELMEREAVAEENLWVRAVNRDGEAAAAAAAAASSSGVRVNDTPRVGAVWRVL